MATATEKKPAAAGAAANTVRLRAAYNDKIAADLQKELGIANVSLIPRLEKITLNIGIGKAKVDK
jgi:large subunit ribosomal protein L5